MQACFLGSLGNGDGSLWTAVLRELGDERAPFDFLLFFVDALNVVSMGTEAPVFFRDFFVEDLGASGDVDMSISGS